MTTASLKELKGRVSAGEYAIDTGEVAGEILTKFALVRRVSRQMMREDEQHPAAPRGPLGTRPTGSVKNSER